VLAIAKQSTTKKKQEKAKFILLSCEHLLKCSFQNNLMQFVVCEVNELEIICFIALT
jgi:hypothetical protein